METNMCIGEGPGSFMAGLAAFCTKDVPVCFTPGAGARCLPVALTLISAPLLLLSRLLVVYVRCRHGEEYPREAVLYCLMGSLCSTVGAILSKQLYIQVLMSAFTAAVDALNCMVSLVQLLLCWNSSRGVRLRMRRRRRRQHLVAISLLLVVAGGFLKSTNAPALRPVSGRSLLNASSWTPILDSTGILGYVLGLLALFISCSSRLPPLCRVYWGHRLTNTHVLSGMLCLLAEALYTAALLHCNTQFGFLLRVMPWLLSSAGLAIIELLILLVHWFTRGNTQQFSPDTERLLGESGLLAGDNVPVKRDGDHKTPSPSQITTKHMQKMTELGHYMDVSFRPSKKDNVKVRPLNPMVEMINSFSDSSFDSSEVSSDLEWDFEATQAHWKKAEGENELLLQEWTTSCSPLTGRSCSSPELGTEEHGPPSGLTF